MRDFIVQNPTHKTLTLTRPITVGSVTIPAGTVIEGYLDFKNVPVDNDPTPINKGTLLPDETAEYVGVTGEDALVGKAIHALKTAANAAQSSANNAQSTADAALARSGGTMTGVIYASSPPIASQAVRNIYAGTAGMTSGSTSLPTGTIYLQYE